MQFVKQLPFKAHECHALLLELLSIRYMSFLASSFGIGILVIVAADALMRHEPIAPMLYLILLLIVIATISGYYCLDLLQQLHRLSINGQHVKARVIHSYISEYGYSFYNNFNNRSLLVISKYNALYAFDVNGFSYKGQIYTNRSAFWQQAQEEKTIDILYDPNDPENHCWTGIFHYALEGGAT